MHNNSLPQNIFTKRREALKKRLTSLGHRAMLVSHAANRYYLSGFELHDPQCNESAGMLVITPGDHDYLLTDSRFLDAAKRVWPEEDIFIYTGNRYQAISSFLRDKGITTLAFESRSLTVDTHARLSEFLNLVPSVEIVEKLRLIKDEYELELMAKSCALNHLVFSKVPNLLVPGRTEAQVAWDIEQLFRNNGASELAFPTIVGIGPNAALPHAIPGDTQITENCCVLIDMGGRQYDYCSDQTRTYAVGNPTAEFSRTLEQVQNAQLDAIRAIKPRMTSREAYAIARNSFSKNGVEMHFTHALGHGIGLETHEGPSLGPISNIVLEPGMVVTVEPGLYYPEWGGVRWEHMVVITEDGCRIL
ncbi:M24 family metallopeptidase [Desulfovibrio inopinatus]|uniref:M24 family metallopeptidase n=1 Tax=Desulfovibrio inopinatus TaxID=102109 RepID=UPI00041DCB23|nr:Xaa-Pro peptidase family protein [Desulfovibrio inopinatus]